MLGEYSRVWGYNGLFGRFEVVAERIGIHRQYAFSEEVVVFVGEFDFC